MNSKDYIPRWVEDYAFDESLIGRHMVFLAGPRQVGKTRLAKHWLEKKECSPLYFNWDDVSTRKAYVTSNRFFESPTRSLGIRDPWIVFDEIHKRNRWRDILKGVYDVFGDEFRFLITGSARLDIFRRSGDSLVGRYNLFHMMPFNIGEIAGLPKGVSFLAEKSPHKLSKNFEGQISNKISASVEEAYQHLWWYGPFPEPFLKQNERFSRKWHQDYLSLVIHEELKDITKIVELDKVENLLFLMPSRIMAPLSMANLAGELEVAHTTVKVWLEQLKRLYLLFPVAPWVKKVPRGLRREKKWYFLDWYYVTEEPGRLENMVATYLYRVCLTLTDMGLGNYQLYYLRTLDKQEIDFIVEVDRKPVLAVEVKLNDTQLSRTLQNRHKWFPDSPTLGVQVVNRREILQKYPNNTWVMSVERFLALLT
ncbi:MAG: AAA family ATPase [Thermodesulfobacteriota bacterium]|nr:AAA family ATPase [Thermodesulfobacteriota bacterium]